MADCQTIDVSEICGVASSQASEPPGDEFEANVWGRMYPLHDAYSKVDLINDEYTFGRDEESSVCITEHQNGCEVPNWQALSKVHFMIFREQPKSGRDQDASGDSRKYGVFLYDKSSNGTFVNGTKIGKNKTCLLKDNSEISLSLKKNLSWVYKEKQRYSDHPDIPRDFLGRYDIGKTLGKGACGEVRLCFDKETGKRSAVKVIEMKKFDKDEKTYKAAMLEVDILQKLNHPCVIKIEGAFQSDNLFLIVLELMEGGELFDWIVSLGKMKEDLAKYVFFQMLLAVRYLHSKDITHRDLKPENVLLTKQGEECTIKITDFGLSKVVGENSLMKTLCGTPSYLAPEVLLNAELLGYGQKCDCWSLGVILFIQLSGYPPFSNEVQTHTLREQITKGLYSFPDSYWSDVSSVPISLIKALLQVDPGDRITVQQAIEHPWFDDQQLRTKIKSKFGADIITQALLPSRVERKRGSQDVPKPSSLKKVHVEGVKTCPTELEGNGSFGSFSPSKQPNASFMDTVS